ncbi:MULTISPECIES: hypothetical protein [unclassified Sulfitobacter]|uniref:hypothetical protein n=1 Tax=unclassified Sulfitobacter TaxID=196795 RepID=UPI0023E1F578|nr:MULTISPECIES: hypothetical protein [unclassified Sulfitobacter]MDF3500563.1 hypothetical protein [Sulfitobacter sp. Ks17]MDF3527860.1 hypothetical protein [Sulfitobacter sp. M77]MDF3531764.1 hypothetical protein [Sulfitobacter sp. S62]
MHYNFRILFFMLIGGAAVVYGVFQVPPLTSGGSGGASGANEAEFNAAVSEELAFCQAQPDAVNCRCFATKSAIIRSHQQPRVPTAVYADKETLARGQAAQGC